MRLGDRTVSRRRCGLLGGSLSVYAAYIIRAFCTM
jgi:hypothetical protein